MKYETVFWDWNGTIIDDLQASIDSVNALLMPRGLKTFATDDEYRNVFCFPVIDYYKKAGFDFKKEPFEILAAEYVDNYNALCRKCKVFPDIIAAVKSLKERGIRQIILSASERGGLIQWLSEIDILKYFDDVIGNDNIYAGGKADIALEWLSDNTFVNIEKAVLVGDTTHDAEVAAAMGCDAVLIPRGHSSRKELEATGCVTVDDGDSLMLYLTKQM